MLCCFVLLLCVAVYGCVACVVECVGRGGGVYASNTSPCVRSKRLPCVHSRCPRVNRNRAHIFYTCGRGAGTHGRFECAHGFFQRVTPHHTPNHTTSRHANTTQDTAHTFRGLLLSLSLLSFPLLSSQLRVTEFAVFSHEIQSLVQVEGERV